MVSCDFCESFKSTFSTEPSGYYFWSFRSLPNGHIKMTSIEAITLTLILTLNVFLSFAITLEAAIQNNLIKSWRFSREMVVVEFRYSMKL